MKIFKETSDWIEKCSSENQNYFIVAVGLLEKFPEQDEGFLVDYHIFYPQEVFKRTGHGGESRDASYRNSKYVDMLQRWKIEDAKLNDTQVAVLWSDHAQHLKENRKDIYLPEENWSLHEAKKAIENEYLWSPHLDKAIGSFSINDLSKRETAEHTLKTILIPEEFQEIWNEAKLKGLTKLKKYSEDSLLYDLISAFDWIRSDAGCYGKTYFEDTMNSARSELEEYKNICSGLSIEPIKFDFIERLEDLRKTHGTNVQFEQLARILVDSLRPLGLKEYDYRGFDVKIGSDNALIKSEFFFGIGKDKKPIEAEIKV
jgi:hypothetical protein